MHPEVKELAGLVQEAADLLLAHGETHWANWMRANAQRIRDLDFGGVGGTLAAFGGMGSINDLILHPINGHKIEESDVEPVNDGLRSLLERIYQLAWRLNREELVAQRANDDKLKGA
jgi:hypothetical protein